MLLEGTDAKDPSDLLHAGIGRSPESRHAGVNSFVKLQKRFENGRPSLKVENLGDSEKLLANSKHFRQTAKRYSRLEDVTNELWGGWLGRYRERLKSAVTAAEREPRHQIRALMALRPNCLLDESSDSTVGLRSLKDCEPSNETLVRALRDKLG